MSDPSLDSLNEAIEEDRFLFKNKMFICTECGCFVSKHYRVEHHARCAAISERLKCQQ